MRSGCIGTRWWGTPWRQIEINILCEIRICREEAQGAMKCVQENYNRNSVNPNSNVRLNYRMALKREMSASSLMNHSSCM